MCARVSVLLTLLLAALLSHPLGSDQHHMCSEGRLSSQEAPHLHCFLMSVERLPKAPYLGSSSAPGLQNLQKFRDSIKAPVTSSVYHTARTELV